MWWRTSRPEPEIPIAANVDGAVLPPSLAAAAVLGPESAPAPCEVAASRVSPGRQVLASAIDAHREALALLAGAQESLLRLQARIDALALIDRRLTEINRANDVEVGRWIADGSQDERPMPPAEVVGLRQQQHALLPDCAAAQLAIPTAQAEYERVAQVVVAAARQRDATLINAAVDCARDIIEVELIRAVENVLWIEARIHGLRQALEEVADRGHNPIPAASRAAGQIGEMVIEAKRRPAVSIAIDQARQFLSELSANPAAALP